MAAEKNEASGVRTFSLGKQLWEELRKLWSSANPGAKCEPMKSVGLWCGLKLSSKFMCWKLNSQVPELMELGGGTFGR